MESHAPELGPGGASTAQSYFAQKAREDAALGSPPPAAADPAPPTWRGWVVQCPAYHGASLHLVPLAEVAGLPVFCENGLDQPEVVS